MVDYTDGASSTGQLVYLCCGSHIDWFDCDLTTHDVIFFFYYSNNKV